MIETTPRTTRVGRREKNSKKRRKLDKTPGNRSVPAEKIGLF